MNNIVSLLSWIFFGDFGLLTLAPRYLFLVLFPIMIFLGFFGYILTRIPFLQKTSPLVNQFFYGVLGLGCTTAALASLDVIEEDAMKRRMIWFLVLLVPCSSQLAIIAAFASMVTLRVFLAYLAFTFIFMAVIYLVLAKCYPLSCGLVKISSSSSSFHPIKIIKDAFFSVTSTIPTFCLGSVIISILWYCGVLDGISAIWGPWLERFLHLPHEAVSLFILNILKRDFGSASLLTFAEGGAFDAVQLVVVLIMLTFSVPCFNSTILLYKQEKLPMASVIWLGSLFVSILFGKIVVAILGICFNL